jgi:spore maturation protein CgeB
MNEKPLNIVILGLSITSSWGNGHATTFRGLIRELRKKGNQITFLERDVPWYSGNRDLAHPPYCTTYLYNDVKELKANHTEKIKYADLVIVGSYVPDGVEIGKFVMETAEGVTAFYDIDTPVTLSKMSKKDHEYLHPDLIAKYDLYLSFTGGPTLELLEGKYRSPMARALYCAVDPEIYYPEQQELKWSLGYLGTYSDDRQPPLKKLMIDAASTLKQLKFVVAGPQYPPAIEWSSNIERIEHIPPSLHRKFYNSQRFTMNITRADMIKTGYSPSVRLFEAAACGTPIISDHWEGIETIFEPGNEILIATSTTDTIKYLASMPEEERIRIGENAKQKVLKYHTAAHRATELENYYKEALCRQPLQQQAMESLKAQ